MFRKIPFETAQPILERFALSEPAAEAVSGEDSPEHVIEALNAGGHTIDLLNVFAYALPPREGICWAIATYRATRELPSDLEASILSLAERWVNDPQERTRLQLMELAEGHNSETPLHWLCNAVAWNGSGSIAPAGGPVVLPAPGLHSSALLGAVALLAEPSQDSVNNLRATAHRLGLEVANGAWPLHGMENG